MDKNIKVTKETVTVSLKLHSHKSGEQKVRYYEANARGWVLQEYPKLEIGRCLKNCVVKNQGPKLEGEWVFEVIQKVIPKEVKKPAVRKKKSYARKKEVVNAEGSDGAN